MRLAVPALLALTLSAGGLTACQRADEQAAETDATTLTVYASLPLQGADGPESQAVANGVRLALRDAGGKVGELTVKLAVLDDSTPSANRWDPRQTAENARTAVRDRTTIAYVGDGPSGATAISLPILNSGGIPQVSPASTYHGLTRGEVADKGEPEKYYPSGERTFARPVPADLVQARAITAGLRADACDRVQLFEDRDVDGRGLASAVDEAATRAGLEVVDRDVVRPDDDPAGLAEDVVRDRADCVVYTGALADWVPALFDALHAAAPDLLLHGGDGVAAEALAEELGAGTQTRTRLHAPPGILEPLPAVREFGARYEEVFGAPPRSGALYGYEAMQLVLDAIRRAGPAGNDRAAVGRALLGSPEREGLLGPYAIGPLGDTTSTRYAQLRVRDGRLVRRRTASYPG